MQISVPIGTDISNEYNFFVISEDFFKNSYTKFYIIENEPTCKHCSLCLSRVINYQNYEKSPLIFQSWNIVYL